MKLRGFTRAAAGFAVVLFVSLQAQEKTSGIPDPMGYREPAPEITALLTAPTPPEPLLHATSGQVALLYREPVITMERLSRTRLGLGGFRFDPEAGTSGVAPLIGRVDIVTVAAPSAEPVVWKPTADAVLDFVRFAPDGKTLSALAVGSGPARLVLFDVDSATERRLDAPVNASWGEPCQWVDNDELLCRVSPADRGPAPAPGPAPILVEHSGGAVPMRTYQNLLENPYEDALFDYYFGGELARVDRSGKVRRVPGLRGLIKEFEPSPDGRYAVITRIQQPYSRLVPARKFPSSVELWDLEAGQRLYASRPEGFGLEEAENDGDEDPRRSAWKPGTSNTLGFIEKTRDADGNRVYRWMALSAPYDGEPVEVVSSEKAIQRFGWTSAGTAYFTTRGETAEEVSHQVVSEGRAQAIWKGVAADRYDNPGHAVRAGGADGPVLEADGRVFIAGDGLSDQGPRPFLDVFDLGEMRIERVFEADPGVYEIVLGVLDSGVPEFVTSRETETESPNLYLHRGGERIQLTRVPDPFPQLAGATRRVVSFTREDGVGLNGTLYLPANHRDGERLPTLVWIYPTEFSDQEQAEQMDLRFFRFHKVKGPSPLAAVVAGYAVLLNPTVPILDEAADTRGDYIPQLVASVEAALDYLVAEGISEPDRFAVAGRSYGAFSSANLLIHSERFATAIAMSGAYNRTLTPFGFQHERRSFWQATDLYTSISPFFHVDEIKLPILIVHGGNDENPGTIPFQARRFFHALVGEGGQARYVELPYEGHHYWARENVLLASAEMLDWLDWTIGSRAVRTSE